MAGIRPLGRPHHLADWDAGECERSGGDGVLSGVEDRLWEKEALRMPFAEKTANGH